MSFRNNMQNVGTTVTKNAKRGGGTYTVIGHINCPRETCKEIIEEREQQIPSKAQKKNGYYWITWSLCPFCGLYSNGNKKKLL